MKLSSRLKVGMEGFLFVPGYVGLDSEDRCPRVTIKVIGEDYIECVEEIVAPRVGRTINNTYIVSFSAFIMRIIHEG